MKHRYEQVIPEGVENFDLFPKIVVGLLTSFSLYNYKLKRAMQESHLPQNISSPKLIIMEMQKICRSSFNMVRLNLLK